MHEWKKQTSGTYRSRRLERFKLIHDSGPKASNKQVIIDRINVQTTKRVSLIKEKNEKIINKNIGQQLLYYYFIPIQAHINATIGKIIVQPKHGDAVCSI